MPIPKDTLGLREASERFGVSIDTLRRRIKDDAMPEAFKTEGKFGSTWVLPIGAMADIADRERWALSLDIAGADTESAAETSGDAAPAESSLDAPNITAGSSPAAVADAVTPPATHATGVGQSTAQPTAQPTAQSSTQTLPKITPASTSPKAVPSPVPTGVPSALPNHDTHANSLPSGIAALKEVDAEKADSKPPIVEENLEWVERLLSAETRAMGAETRLELMEADAVATEKRIAQLTRDLEHERAELRRLRTDLASEEKAKAVAVGRTEELRVQLKTDRTSLEARIGEAQSEAQSHLDRADALQVRLGDAHAAMGWWSRRRLIKIDPEIGNDSKSNK